MPYTGLIQYPVRARARSLERTVWVLEPTAPAPTAVLIFLDGELYIERTLAPGVVRQLRAAQLIPNVATLFVSHNGAAARHKDLLCCPEYARFIAEDVVDWARRKYPGALTNVLVGLSLSGLAAAYIASRYPQVFRSAVCQSPSFWWERARFADELPAAREPGQEFWVCVGSRETDKGISHAPSGLLQELTQLEGCVSAMAALRAKGYGGSYREYDGGHDPDCWREDLALALPWVWRRAQLNTAPDQAEA